MVMANKGTSPAAHLWIRGLGRGGSAFEVIEFCCAPGRNARHRRDAGDNARMADVVATHTLGNFAGAASDDFIFGAEVPQLVHHATDTAFVAEMTTELFATQSMMEATSSFFYGVLTGYRSLKGEQH